MSSLQKGNRADNPQNYRKLTSRRRSYSMHKMRSNGGSTNWQFMSLSVTRVQLLSQFPGTLRQTARLMVATVLIVKFRCHACGARLEWHLRVKAGGINETRQ